MTSPPRSISFPSTKTGTSRIMQRTGSLPCTGSLSTGRYGQYLKPCSSLDDLDEQYDESSPSPGSNESLNEGGIFSRLKRRLSGRRKSKRKRKGSEDSYFLGALFSEDVGKRLNYTVRDNFMAKLEVFSFVFLHALKNIQL